LIRGAFGVGGALALAVVGHGVFWGDAQGEGGLAAMGLGGYGVLKKPELDLAPVTTLLALVAVTERSRPLENLPVDMQQRLAPISLAWTAENRERVLAEWTRRFAGKSEPAP
jgi:hypothetical protein